MRSRCAILLPVALSLLWEPVAAQSIVQTIPLPSTTYWNQAWGIAADSTGLYLSSGTSTTTAYNYGFIYKLDFNGTPLDSLNPAVGYSQGLAMDDTSFYYVRRYTATSTIVRLTRGGIVIDSLRFSSPNRFIGGIAWDGSHVWVSDYGPTSGSAYLYKIDWNIKTIVDSIRTIGLQPQGIAWDGQYLYYAMDLNGSEPNQNLIYQVDPITGDTVRTIPMPDGPSTDSGPKGLAWDGHFLWLVAEPVAASSGRVIYKYNLSGTGTPDINLQASLSFAGVRIDSAKTLTLSVENTGTAPLTVNQIVITDETVFSTTLEAPFVVSPGGSVPLPVTYRPDLFGGDSAALQVFSDDPDESMKSVTLRGFGIYGQPFLFADTTHDFGTRRVGSFSSWDVRIRNYGAQPLIITGITDPTDTFSRDPVTLPLQIDSLGFSDIRFHFRPDGAGSFAGVFALTGNSSTGTVRIHLSGTGDATPVPLGQPLWTLDVPDHPVSNTFRLVKAVRALDDVNGDGKPDVVIATENYWTMALNGNGSVDTDTLWSFSSYISSSSAGSIGTTGDYSHQKALAVVNDLDNDSLRDVVIGTGGGNEHVYALSGRTGHIIWTFGTDAPDSFGLGDFTGVDGAMDFNNDGVPDILAAASATQTGGLGGRRSVYLFNGTNGNIMWQSPLPGFTHGVASLGDVSGDGVPDAIGAVGEPAYKATAFSGTNGALLWDFPLTSGSGGGKEVIAFPVAGSTPDVILGAFWGPVYRVDGESGTEVWNHPTGGVGGGGVLQLQLLHDVTGDGVDDVLVALLGGGALCLNGATGDVAWSVPSGNTMGIAAIPDLNQDGNNDVAIAVQNQGAMIVSGQNGVQLALYPMPTIQAREVAVVPDIDGNHSYEIVAGSNQGDIALISGGVNAGPNSAGGLAQVPDAFALEQNFPNPFNPTTTIRISVPVQSDLSLTVYDILGRVVKSFAFERVAPGIHDIVWDAADGAGHQVASGAYFYTMQAGDYRMTRRMVFLK